MASGRFFPMRIQSSGVGGFFCQQTILMSLASTVDARDPA